MIITDERNEGAENAVNAAIEYIHANDMATVNSKTFIKLAESPRETVAKGLAKILIDNKLLILGNMPKNKLFNILFSLLHP